MAEDEPKGGWFGTVKGTVALVASALGIVGALIGVYKFYDERRGDPKFEGPIAASSRAKDFARFLTRHDDDAVRLDIQCVPSETDAACAQGDPRDLPYIEGEKEQLVLLELFSGEPCVGEAERCDGTYWLTFRLPDGSDELVSNGRFGAGNLVAKGKFKVLVRGGLGTSPPSVENIELVAIE